MTSNTVANARTAVLEAERTPDVLKIGTVQRLQDRS